MDRYENLSLARYGGDGGGGGDNDYDRDEHTPDADEYK